MLYLIELDNLMNYNIILARVTFMTYQVFHRWNSEIANQLLRTLKPLNSALHLA